MKSTDDQIRKQRAFALWMKSAWMFYDREPAGADYDRWYLMLGEFPPAALESAFRQHMADSKHGSYFPKPADIIRNLPAIQADDGRPGAEEAWGMLLSVIRDERETGFLTDEMREAWSVCQPILDLGDDVGARMAFREAYHRAVEKARKMTVAPRWTPTLGTDTALREKRLTEAVQARKIGFDGVRALLPGPTPENITHVAGLLEGPGASAEELRAAERLRQLAAMLSPDIANRAAQQAQALAAMSPDERPGALAAMLRTGFGEAEQRRADAAAQQRQAEAEKKAAIRELLDQHQRQQADGKDAA